MEASDMRDRAASFGSVAEAYAKYRPGYPDEAVRWLVGTSPGTVLELGAGAGALTRSLSALGHEVIATDPSAGMLSYLRKAVPKARTMAGRAEDIALPSSSVDVVVAAQAFHWFDRERALTEIARVLRPGGVLALVWNSGDFQVPWVRRVFQLTDTPDAESLGDPLDGSELFSTSETRVFRHWQRFHKHSLVGFVASNSRTAMMAADERDAVLAEVGRLYDSYGRGPDGMLMPWRARCYRARVSGLASAVQEGDDAGYDDALLIDFP